MPTSLWPRNWFLSTARSIFWRAPPKPSCLANPAIPNSSPPIWSRKRSMTPDLIHLHHDPRKLWREPCVERVKRPRETTRSPANPCERQGAILVAPSREQAREWSNALAPEHITVTRKGSALHSKCRLHIRRRLLSAGRGRLRLWAQPRSAHCRASPLPRRPQRSGFLKLVTVQELTRDGLKQSERPSKPGADRRPPRPCRIHQREVRSCLKPRDAVSAVSCLPSATGRT